MEKKKKINRLFFFCPSPTLLVFLFYLMSGSKNAETGADEERVQLLSARSWFDAKLYTLFLEKCVVLLYCN